MKNKLAVLALALLAGTVFLGVPKTLTAAAQGKTYASMTNNQLLSLYNSEIRFINNQILFLKGVSNKGTTTYLQNVLQQEIGRQVQINNEVLNVSKWNVTSTKDQNLKTTVLAVMTTLSNAFEDDEIALISVLHKDDSGAKAALTQEYDNDQWINHLLVELGNVGRQEGWNMR